MHTFLNTVSKQKTKELRKYDLQFPVASLPKLIRESRGRNKN